MLAPCAWWRATGVSPTLTRRWSHGPPRLRPPSPPPPPPPPVRLPPALAAALEAATADFRPRQLRAAAAGLLADLRTRSRSVERGGVAVVESDDGDDGGLDDLLADDDDGDDDDTSPPWLDERRRGAPPAAPRRRAAASTPLTYTSPAAAAAYAAIRSPATYAATLHALTAVRAAAPRFSPASALDFGAGAAAATAAAVAVFGPSLTSVTAVERSDAMARVGAAVVDAWRQGVRDESETLHPSPPPLRWCRRLPHPGVGATYDLVLAAYAVGESDGGVDGAWAVIRSLWRHVAPRGLLVVVEPATPTGGAVVAAARTLTLASRAPAHVVAPCMQDGGCPLPRGRVCRSGQRSLRPRLAAAVTPGPGRGPPAHQDEMFSYVAVCKAEREAGEEEGCSPCSRLVGPPRRRARHVLLATCTPGGDLATVTVTKGGGGGGLYRAARKAGWGGVWPPQEGEAGASSPSDRSDTDEPESSDGSSSSSSDSSGED